MSFLGMQYNSPLVKRDDQHLSGWFFGLSIAATISYVVQYWWNNIRYGGGRGSRGTTPKDNKDDRSKSDDSIEDMTTPSSPSSSRAVNLQVEIPQHQTTSDLDSLFEEAVEQIRHTNFSVATVDKLTLYGLYKQVTEGNAPPVCWSVSVSDQSKHHAWSQYRNMASDTARQLYVAKAHELLAKGGSGTKADSGAMGGVGVSSMPLAPAAVDEHDMTVEERLFAAAGDNDVVKLGAILKTGIDVNVTDDGGQTALHMAADAGANETLELLLKHGADEKAADHYGISVLQAAVIAGHVSITDKLLKAGADPDQPDDDGDTPR